MAGQPAVQPPVEAEPRLAGVAAEPSLPESSQPEVGQPEPDQSDPSPTLSKKQLKKQLGLSFQKADKQVVANCLPHASDSFVRRY